MGGFAYNGAVTWLTGPRSRHVLANPGKLSKVVCLYALFSRSMTPTLEMRQVPPGVGDSARAR